MSRIAINCCFFIATLLALPGCTKSGSGDAAKFVGSWVGTTTCSTGQVSETFYAGSGGSSVTIPGSIGTKSGCYKVITLNCTASGNILSMPKTNFTDSCGQTYTIVVTASINVDTLTFIETETGANTANCTFVGVKQ